MPCGDEPSLRAFGGIAWLSAMSLAFIAIAWASWRGKPWAATAARWLVTCLDDRRTVPIQHQYHSIADSNEEKKYYLAKKSSR